MSKPWKSFTKPIKVICVSLASLIKLLHKRDRLTTIPHATIIDGNQIEGLSFFNNMLLGTSKAQYVKKKAVAVNLCISKGGRCSYFTCQAPIIFCTGEF